MVQSSVSRSARVASARFRAALKSGVDLPRKQIDLSPEIYYRHSPIFMNLSWEELWLRKYRGASGQRLISEI